MAEDLYPIASSGYMGDLPHKTHSLCPECKKLLPAIVYADGDVVRIKKTCPEHGEFSELYWESIEMYERGRKQGAPGKIQKRTNTPEELGNTGLNCPFDCGICQRHKSHTALANIVATNRCDLSCWYCFFYAKEGQPIYEPSLEQVRLMMRNLRNEKPVPCNAIQITGGEPTLRDDLIDMIKIAKEEGIGHVQVNTDGVNLAFKPDLAKQIREAGTNTIYMSFDGVSSQSNPKNHWEAPYAIEQCRKAGMGIVLVPTVIKGVNDQEIGAIVNFGLNNMDVIRGVNFQPVSLVGRMPKELREKQRITIPKVIKNIEEQTNGVVTPDDFYTVPSIHAITKFVEAFTGKQKYDLTTHFACGAATYLYKDEDKITPITQFVDVDGLFEYLTEKAEELEGGKNKYWVGLKILKRLGGFIDDGKKPKGFDLGKMLINALLKHDYRSLGNLHHKLLFIGMMHFQDPYNYDVERVERCCIHYVVPDGRIIPFCTFNVIPEIYRDKIQAEYAMTAREWEIRTGKKLADDKYQRNAGELAAGETYKKAYELKDLFKVGKSRQGDISR